MEIARNPVRQHQRIEADVHFALGLDALRRLALGYCAVDVTAARDDDLPRNGDRRDGFEIDMVALLSVLGIERIAQRETDVRAVRDHQIGRGGSRLLDQLARLSLGGRIRVDQRTLQLGLP